MLRIRSDAGSGVWDRQVLLSPTDSCSFPCQGGCCLFRFSPSLSLAVFLKLAFSSSVRTWAVMATSIVCESPAQLLLINLLCDSGLRKSCWRSIGQVSTLGPISRGQVETKQAHTVPWSSYSASHGCIWNSKKRVLAGKEWCTSQLHLTSTNKIVLRRFSSPSMRDEKRASC